MGLELAAIVSALAFSIQTSRVPPSPKGIETCVYRSKFHEAVSICEQHLAGDAAAPLHNVPQLLQCVFSSSDGSLL